MCLLIYCVIPQTNQYYTSKTLHVYHTKMLLMLMCFFPFTFLRNTVFSIPDTVSPQRVGRTGWHSG